MKVLVLTHRLKQERPHVRLNRHEILVEAVEAQRAEGKAAVPAAKGVQHADATNDAIHVETA